MSNVVSPQSSALNAFVLALSDLGDSYHDQYMNGKSDIIDNLQQEESNLLHARELARQNSWWSAVIGTMQALDILYGETGRKSEWTRLVNEIIPDFVDPSTQG